MPFLMCRSGQDGDEAAAVSSRRRAAMALEASLQQLIDPIDWATYETHLYGNKDVFLGRCAVLLGALQDAGASPAHGSSTPELPGAVHGEANVLRMAAPGSRFAYLPINTLAGLHAAGPQPTAGVVLLQLDTLVCHANSTLIRFLTSAQTWHSMLCRWCGGARRRRCLAGPAFALHVCVPGR